jgi:hypothetical membrane protein
MLLLRACGVAGPILFMLVFLVEGALRPGYRPWRHFVSLLARGDRGWVQAGNFMLCGGLSLAFAAGLARTGGASAFAVLFGIFGVGLVASGIFPCDAGLGYPPGALATWPRTATRSGNLHNLAGALVFGSLCIAAFVAAARSASHAFALYSIASGVLVLVLFIMASALAAGLKDDSADPPIGLVQRLAIGVGWTWMAVFALAGL